MDNRENILQCALELFASKGYNSVGVQEIVKRAGITKPTLYHYFGSKQGLLENILEKYFKAFIPKVENAADYQHDVPYSLMKTARIFFAFARRHQKFYRFQLSLTFSPPDSIRKQLITPYNMKVYEILEELFLKASVDHGNMKGRHKAYALSFIGMLNTYILAALDGNLILDEDLVYRATHRFMHGIYS